jgi:hypothetical protein
VSQRASAADEATNSGEVWCTDVTGPLICINRNCPTLVSLLMDAGMRLVQSLKCDEEPGGFAISGKAIKLNFTMRTFLPPEFKA